MQESAVVVNPQTSGKDQKEQNKAQEPRQIWFCELFRFATCFDIVLMIIGSIAAMAMGTALPAFAFIWGQMTDSFSDPDQMVEQSRQTMFLFIYIGIGAFFAGWLMFACWMIAGERQGISCRKAYLHSLLRQQIGWFDMINQSQLSSKFAADTFSFQNALGEKISMLVMTLAMLIAGFVFAFVTGWLMTLVVLATLPALAIAGYFYMSIIGNKDKKQEKEYSKAGGRAEQAISSIKTVKQLNGQQYQSQAYQQCLNEAGNDSCKYAIYAGAGIGGIFFVMLASYSLGFWYGSRCVVGDANCPQSVSDQKYTAGDVLVVFFSVIMASFNLIQINPALTKIALGRQAGARIFEVIDREPLITNPPNGKKFETFQGVIKFEDVTFAYPKDKNRIILNSLTISFDLKHTALVGESGCGKSTVLQLIMRFYDPDQGRITIDGVDLRQVDLMWLREQIGYVGQEPVLFATTIRENLTFGKENATQEEIIEALKKAEAYDFIKELQDGLDTYVGHGGSQLSGGQKQRIAIARALLRNPQILLLDEATSALDRRNEKLIQDTLDEVSQNRTTITVAHRVKTIMKSDIVYVMDRGELLEKGKFRELTRYKDYKMQDKDEIIEEKKQKKVEQEEDGFLDLEIKKQDLTTKKEEKDELTKEQLEKKEQQQLIERYKESSFSRIFSYASDKCGIFVVGIFLALTNGVIFPVFSIFLARMLTALITMSSPFATQAMKDEEEENSKLYALIFLILGIAAFILTTFQIAIFTMVGESITRKIRIQTFSKIMKMPIPWFDLPRNNGGILTARLSTDCNAVNGMVTTVVSITIQNLSSLLCGIIIAFVHEWRTSLVALGLIPFMILAGAIQMKFTTGFSDETDKAYKDSSNLIMESMTNIRTVSSFGYEGVVANKYDEKMVTPYHLAIKKGNISGVLYGLSQFIMFIIFGLIFFLGAVFVRQNEDAQLMDMFTAVYAILFSAMTAGNNSHFAPDAAACQASAANLFAIIDSVDEEQKQTQEQSKLLKAGIEGDIVFKNVSFKYESRNEYVFKNMNIRVKYGQKAAFVGTSGCGKSTILQLIQKFYAPQSGQIFINDINLKDFDIHYLRSCFGVVSQEPVLFNTSFKENIKYNLTSATDQQIMEAAIKANALSFIMGTQKIDGLEGEIDQNKDNEKTGFDRGVGVKGSHISGGQKQRVAIARAILRNPQKLLLDEATSALDSANEKKVQESLDKIMVGKTTINVAHRIQTIKNSDEIYVFEKGKIVQSGSYNNLVSKKGYFYNLERGTQFV